MGDALLQALPVLLLGGLLGLDVVSFPQAMLARPLVGATLTGALLGAPMAGLLCGAVLECIALETLPVGASRYPEWGSASVVAGATVAALTPHPSAIVIGTIFGLAFAWIGGESMVWHRKLIARVARPRLSTLATGSFSTVAGLQLFGMTADFARAVALTGLGLLVSGLVAPVVTARWGESGAMTDAITVGIAGAVAAFAVWKVFHGVQWARVAVAAGFAIGVLLVLARQ
ncbi:MAG: PTS sugar transporter subunit IIC [Gemmatimonadaceae bacterium]|jgi:PTS system mannose-specific IIC component|nr:PTS sugar transporter subunit IIC [Gemmatimonadaceae bacterium]